MEQAKERIEDNLRPKRRSDELGDHIIIMLMEKSDRLFEDVTTIKAAVESLQLTDQQTAALIEELKGSKMNTPQLVLFYRSHKKKVITAVIGMLGTVIWASMQAKLQALWHWFLKL